MPAFVALLYSITLPDGRLRMADLLSLADELALEAPRTLLSTGNLVFRADDPEVPSLEARLEAGYAARFGRQVNIIVREAERFRRAVAANPFAVDPPAEVSVRVQRDALTPEVERSLQPVLSPGERIRVIDGDLWMAMPGAPAQSRLANALTPRRLGIGTSRGLATMQRIDRMLASMMDD